MTVRRQLTVVYIVTDSRCESLCLAVNSMGYVVDSIQWTEWLNNIVAFRAKQTILLLNGQIPRSVDVLSLFKENMAAACLGVCCYAARCWDDRILRNCADFLVWPCHEEELTVRLWRTFGNPHVQVNDDHETAFLEQFVDLNLLGRSPAFVVALKLIKKYALCDAPVLIEGETGTGKELASRAIHYLSDRRNHSFTPVNCGAIPDSLIESELFGHEKGTFTDAKESQPGLVAEAHNGTLFLDEVDSLSTKAQVALLRFLENKEYRSLGSKKTKKANVRIIVATNASLAARAKEGLFRNDLLYRLNVLSVKLPALRERGDDIRLLAEHFISKYSSQYKQSKKSIHSETLEWMMRYSWPGNVRELDNFLHKEFLLCSTSTIHIAEEQDGLQKPNANSDNEGAFAFDTNLKKLKQNTIAALEKEYLCWLMKETQGNISLAARRAGQQRSALRRLLQKHGIDKNARNVCF